MDYTTLITAEHADKANFVAAVALLTSGSVDLQTQLSQLPRLLDFDTAQGDQLDKIGVWIGLSRQQNVPTLGTVMLADVDYRVLLRAKLLADHWDGGMDTLQVILASLFPNTGITLYAVDRQDMSMDIYLTAGTLSPVQLALLQGGLLVPRPEGVLINGIIILTGPLFGLDYDNSSISGFDTGSFATYA